jgi:hypothetical protein
VPERAAYYGVSTRRCFGCEHCGYQVYPTAGTPFEKTRTSLRGLVLRHAPVLRDAERRGSQGSAAPARRDLQDGVAHVPFDAALHGLRRWPLILL